MMRKYLAFDGGGTFVKYALMDEEAGILKKGKFPTPKAENSTLEDLFKEMDPIAAMYREQISGIAVSIPGMLDSRKGFCTTGGMMSYLSGQPFAQILKDRYHLPASIENDGKCAALAEHWKGSLRGVRNGAVVILGTGVGGGLILGGKLYRGTNCTAGEYSYILADVKRKEEYSGFWGIQNGSEMLAKYVAAHTGEDWEDYDGWIIFGRANAGDEQVLAGLKDFTDRLAAQIYNLNVLLDLEVIAVGGGISRQPLLFEYIEKSMKELLDNHPIRSISPYIPEPRVTNCEFFNDANLIGALYHFFELQAENHT